MGLTLKEVVQRQAFAKSPLVCVESKIIYPDSYNAVSFASAAKLGGRIQKAEITKNFKGIEVGLTAIYRQVVILVKFNRDASDTDIGIWLKGSPPEGFHTWEDLKIIEPKHLFGIVKKYRDLQLEAPIVALGSIRCGHFLFLGSQNKYGAQDKERIVGQLPSSQPVPKGYWIGFYVRQ